MNDPSQQPRPLAGKHSAADLRIGLIVSRFNSFITDRLLAAAQEALAQSGATPEQIDVVRVPGSFEIPLAAKKLALSQENIKKESKKASKSQKAAPNGAAPRYDALIAIGCVLRGETPHFDYVASEVARGVQLAQMDTGVPIIFCVLTCDTLEQAIDRAGLKGGNKGYDAALAALEMASLARQLRNGSVPPRLVRAANTATPPRPARAEKNAAPPRRGRRR